MNSRCMCRAPLAVATLVTALWLWSAWCVFPNQDWNSVRLAPVHMLLAGANPYPGAHEGPLTTWTYGPVPLFWLMPAAFAPDVVTSIFIAGALNLLAALLPLFACALWSPQLAGATTSQRFWTVLLALALWPAQNLHFIQADNYAVAFGLLGNLLLLRAKPTDDRSLWGAALLTACAVWSKQTEITLVAAQMLFLLFRHGAKSMAAQAARTLVAGLALALVALTFFDVQGLWHNLAVVPRKFVRVDLVSKALEPAFLPYVVCWVLAPLLAIGFGVRRIFKGNSVWLLPALAFLVTLPTNLAGFATAGGTVNALHGVLYLLPGVAAWMALRISARTDFGWAATALVGGMICLRIFTGIPVALRPCTLGLREGMSLARQLKGEIYFPWNPLLAYYADGRFDHVEDGLKVRVLARESLAPGELMAHLPPKMALVAYHGAVNPGFISCLLPPDAPQSRYGEWVLIPWMRQADADTRLPEKQKEVRSP